MGNLKALFKNLSSWVVAFSTVTFIIDKSIFMEVMIGADMQVLKQIWEFIIKIFKFLWGKDIEYTPDEFYSDTRILKPEQIWLFLRRFLVLVLCYMVVSKTYNFYKFHWYNYKACRGKDICIIQGPDMHHHLYYHRYAPIISDILKNRYVLLIQGQQAELYDIKKNKFFKLNDTQFQYSSSDTNILVDNAENFLILKDLSSESTSFNINTKKFENLNMSNFNNEFLNYISSITDIYKIDDNRFLTYHYKDKKMNLNTRDFKYIKKIGDKNFKKFVFSYKTKEGNTIFVNVDSTYIFKDKENILIEADKKSSQRNKNIVNNIDNVVKYYYGRSIDDVIFKLGFISISNSKILFLPYSTSMYGNGFKKTFIYDLTTNKITDGPIFNYVSPREFALKIDKNKWIFFGGEINDKKSRTSQILIIKNKRKEDN